MDTNTTGVVKDRSYSTNPSIDHAFYRHSEKQTHEPVTGELNGKIPSWLQGTLIRNGPGITRIGKDQYAHLFDGLSVLHHFNISDGQAKYQSRALESESYKINMAAQRIVVSEFGTCGFGDPCLSTFQKFRSRFAGIVSKGRSGETMTDNCNVNVAYYGDQLYAMTETAFLRRIDPENLRTIGPRTNITDYVVMNTATAHPHILEDGTALNMGNNFHNKKGTHYCIVKVPPSYNTEDNSYKNAKIIAEIPCRWKMYPSYYHSFGMTKDKIIFIESPLCMNLPKLATAALFRNSFKSAMSWYPNEKARIYVVSIEDGKIHPVVYETKDLFAFHHINAYEENGQLVVDVAGYSSGDIIFETDASKVNDSSKSIDSAFGRRYVLPLNVSAEAEIGKNLVDLPDTTATAHVSKQTSPGGVVVECTPQRLSKNWVELPRINYQYNGKKYNFFYATTSEKKGVTIPEPNMINKVNISTGEETNWVGEEGMVSEPVFIADPTKDNASEDDGVVVTSILHKDDPTNVTLLILDAKNMKEIASVKFKADGVVTPTFHGQWANKADKVHVY